MAIIEVLCVIDGQSLKEIYPEAKRYRVALSHAQIHPHARMITRQRNVLDHQASDDLHIRASRGDQVKWRAVSLTDDRVYKVNITAFTSVDSNPRIISSPDYQDGEDAWIALAEGVGTDAYYLEFEVLAPREATTPYRFAWDPAITVTRD